MSMLVLGNWYGSFFPFPSINLIGEIWFPCLSLMEGPHLETAPWPT